jgi:hypothetical protein
LKAAKTRQRVKVFATVPVVSSGAGKRRSNESADTPSTEARGTMTAPDANSTAETLVKAPGASATGIPGPPARPEEQPILPKVKSQNIHVSQAVVEAAQKDGEDLLKSLRTVAAGLTQTEAEDRARTTGPNEVAQ